MICYVQILEHILHIISRECFRFNNTIQFLLVTISLVHKSTMLFMNSKDYFNVCYFLTKKVGKVT